MTVQVAAGFTLAVVITVCLVVAIAMVTRQVDQLTKQLFTLAARLGIDPNDLWVETELQRIRAAGQAAGGDRRRHAAKPTRPKEHP
jgi:outer membrane murein-binding lipoprotein Lpp